ncbi:MAG: hypothetical protein EZS28_020616 [Streblomastix strix]|uniref:Uncharacterized protein n=1 Tax=Streblomastix strix TaxID=222440 RepID=A0A5J4VMM6_9EUKA|nr:MAG: hypothetical protein EZS28_020616 [Streblomastix strix]
MGFFSKIANFGSKILGGVKHAAQWVAPALHKVLSTVARPVGMIHPGIGGALGAGAGLAGAVDRLYSKRGGNSAGGLMKNEDYQLFIDNDNALFYAANNQIIDGQASDFALKIAADGLLTVKNLKVLNFDFVAQINQLINEVNQLQSTVGSIDSDIVGVKNDIITIQQELARQQHFRGYYLLNSDITSLPDSADGDFAFSAESGTVWMYDTTWYNSGQVVPDQVSPASDAVPLVDNTTGAAGVSNEYSRGDHQHPLQISSVLPSADTATGEAGSANTYARSDHTHHVNLCNDIPLKDSGTGTAGASNIYANAQHQHPLNVDPTVANVQLVNATAAANGPSDFYSRNDHVHPQQLTYDGNITATKFIKTGGLATEILCANGDTTTIDSKLSRTYNGSAGGWIRLCNFPAGASAGSPFIEFKVYSMYNAVQTIRLVPYYTVNGINTVYGIFTAPTKISAIYVIEQGVNQLFHNHSGSGTSAIYSAYVRLESAGTVTIVVSDQSTYYTNRITEILTQDVVQGVANGTQIPITYDLANGGIINNMLQVNPTGRTYTTFNNGIRIGNYNTEYSSLYLGCSASAINTTQTGQWEISKTNDNALTINPSSLRQADLSVGLSINGDSSIIKFNGNELVNVGTDQTITGIKQFNNVVQINPTNNRDYTEGIRISRSTNNQWSNLQFGCDSNQTYGFIDNQWLVGTSGGDFLNPLGFVIVKAGEQITANRGLMISADGNTLTFNGRVL